MKREKEKEKIKPYIYSALSLHLDLFSFPLSTPPTPTGATTTPKMSFLPGRNQSLPISQPDPPTDQQSHKKWWQFGWGWILSHKPGFAADLEINEDEKRLIASHHKGSRRHVFYKFRSEFRRILGSHNEGLPVTFRYDSNDYAKNFDGLLSDFLESRRVVWSYS